MPRLIGDARRAPLGRCLAAVPATPGVPYSLRLVARRGGLCPSRLVARRGGLCPLRLAVRRGRLHPSRSVARRGGTRPLRLAVRRGRLRPSRPVARRGRLCPSRPVARRGGTHPPRPAARRGGTRPPRGRVPAPVRRGALRRLPPLTPAPTQVAGHGARRDGSRQAHPPLAAPPALPPHLFCAGPCPRARIVIAATARVLHPPNLPRRTAVSRETHPRTTGVPVQQQPVPEQRRGRS